MSELKTIRDIAGLGDESTSISDSALIIIDAQNTYCQGVMKLAGIDNALKECGVLLERFRKAGRPVFHIRHDAGPGTPYDVSNSIGQIVDALTPSAGEPLITKNYPNSFAGTDLDALVICDINPTRIRFLVPVFFTKASKSVPAKELG